MGEKIKKLRIVKSLPQIIIPAKKNEIFIDWYNKDLRFQDEIPHTFERGYLKIENNFFPIKQYADNNFIKAMAKAKRVTFRDVENAINEFDKMTTDTVVYFEFKGNMLYIEVYLRDVATNTLEINLANTKAGVPNPTIEEALSKMFLNPKTSFQEMYTYNCFVILQCALWYMATTTNTKKYKRENKESKPKYYSEEKTVINVKRNKTITTPIYDMNKVRIIKVDGLIKRRKGWTYSHSFQVHGHYRHYADGKTIFINSYIKGRGKEEMPQILTLSPKESV